MADKAKPVFSLTGIMIIAVLLRAAAVSFGLPHSYHADEPIVVHHALAYGTGDFNPHFFKIPPLVSYLLFLAYGAYYAAGRAMGWFGRVQDFEIAFYADPTPFYLIARILFGVTLGALTVYAVYRLVKRFFSEPAAAVSALFLAVCYLHVRDSHYVYVDIPLLLVMVLGFFPFFKILEKGHALQSHVAAGVCIGLATAIKYNGAFLAVPYVACALWAKRRSGLFQGVAIAFVCSLVTFVVLNPFAVIDGPFFLEEIFTQAQTNTGILGNHGMLGLKVGHYLTYALWGAMGLPLLVLSMYGMLGAFQSFEPKRAVLAIYLLGYYGVLCVAGQPYARYVLPMLPFAMILAGDGVVGLGAKAKGQRAALFTVVLVICIVPTLSRSLKFHQIMAADDTRTLAKAWIEENIPAGSRIALERDFYMPLLKFSRKQLEEKLAATAGGAELRSKSRERRLRYALSVLGNDGVPDYELYYLVDENELRGRSLFKSPTILFDYEVLRALGIEYVVMSAPDQQPREESFREQLRREGELVAEFNPYPELRPEMTLDNQSMTGGPFLWKDLKARDRNGPILSVYRLR
ncbi:MAG: glycosyltransferase family 39 protein [Candidatus Omnitrophota bacterium]|nr:glycosyltransferase family 39 protein [Candidatus Omnitrophota bacterium]